MAAPKIWWIRSDLRLADNPALSEAVRAGEPVVPVYVWCADSFGAWAPGEASRCWLESSLAALAASLEAIGSRLILREGDPVAELVRCARECDASEVLWNRRYEPALVDTDTRAKQELKAQGLGARSFCEAVLNEPHAVQNRQGGPYKVFTPYWKHCRTLFRASGSAPAPTALRTPDQWPASVHLDDVHRRRIAPHPFRRYTLRPYIF